MGTTTELACDLLYSIGQLNRAQDLHPHYHQIARRMAQFWRAHQVFLMVRRLYAGWEQNELGFWVYAGGEICDRYRDVRPGAIVEVALSQSPALQAVSTKVSTRISLDDDPVLRHKLFMACAPASDLSTVMRGMAIRNDEDDVVGFLFVPEAMAEHLAASEAVLLARAVAIGYDRTVSAYAESHELQASLSAMAGELLAKFNQAASAHNAHADPPATDDVLQAFLDYTRTTMNAQKCALFLVSNQGDRLTLERISEPQEERSTLHYERIPHIPSYDLTHYDPGKPGQGVTPWVLHRRKPFNARSYEELLANSEGHHKGNWDAFIYGSNEDARRQFQCVYMTPVLAGDRAIGVLKCENRTGSARIRYYDSIDERKINILAGVLASLVVSQRTERRVYDRALPAMSEILLRDFGKPVLFENLLVECCSRLHAQFCALFVVTNRTDLSLRAIVGLDPDKTRRLNGFCYKNYRQSDGLTCLVLKENTSFNIRTYQDLADRAERKGPGKWDAIVYDGDAAARFKSLYSIPLRIGGEDIGVLKVENKSDTPYYFTESDERLFDLIGRLIAIGVKYDNEAYLGLMLRAAEMGFLASGIAHEFNTYLQGILAIAQNIKSKTSEASQKVLLTKLSKQIQLATKAIESFRMIRDRRQAVETFAVDKLVDEVTAIVQERFRNSNVVLDVQKSGLEVTMNPAEFQTILINLLRNAYDAVLETKRPGKVSVGVRSSGTETFVIEVADTGPGIDPDIEEYLFTPYFSTKASRGGSGMGLFWIRRIVERSDGSIDRPVNNEHGGATFRVTLPIRVPAQHAHGGSD